MSSHFDSSHSLKSKAGSPEPMDMKDLVENLFPQGHDPNPPPSAPVDDSSEETIIKIPGAMVHLIDKQNSVELACGEFSILCLQQGSNAVAIIACIGDVQWPLTKDEASVKLDESHYFFSLRSPPSDGSDSDSDDDGDDAGNLLNYGLTFASKGQENLLKELDGILEKCSSFSVQKVKEKSEVLDGSVAKEVAPSEILESKDKKEMMEERSAAYWTTLAPNVEEYSGCMAKVIAVGSGQLIRGILWCGDVTVDRLNWGNEMLKKRLEPNSQPQEISEETLRRINRVKRVSKMSEKVATGILSGVVRVTGFFTSSVANSRVGKKFLDLLPGEVILASLDGFGKICDAVEVAGKNVLSTSSVVTTGLVSHRYGDQAAEATSESLDAAGHAVGAAWAVFKIRNAFNPKHAINAKSLAKEAAAEFKAKKSK